MTELAGYEIQYKEYLARFKLIRKERDLHLGEHLLMKDSKSKRRVIVKNQSYSNEQQFDTILEGVRSLLALNSCPFLVHLVGYTVNPPTNTLNLIYEYHDNTLEESVRTSSVHGKPLSEKSLLTFIEHMVNALQYLSQLQLNHLDIKPSNILEQNKDMLDMGYKLFYTNYTVDAVVQIKSLDVSVEGYYLSTQQLEELAGEDKQGYGVPDRVKWDLQSLGLLALNMGSLACKDRYYTFGSGDRVVLSDDVLMKRLKELKRVYSKKIVRLIEALLDGNQGSLDDIIQKDDRSRMRSSRVSSEDRNQQIKRLFNRGKGSVEVLRSPSSGRPSQARITEQHRSSKLERLTPSERQKYLVNLDVIEQKIIYKSGTKHLLPGMKEKRYSDNSKYIGEMSANGQQRQGKGIYYYAEGDVYAGEWQDNTLQGYGIYLFSNGEKYEGEVVKGVKSGKGEYVYSNGNRYVGDWLNDRKNGVGTYYFQLSGDVYEGNFFEGSKEGLGKYLYANGDMYEGNFHKGEKNGQGIIRYADGTVVSGTFQNNLLAGKSTVKYFNGDTSQCVFQRFMKEGFGVYKYQDGSVYNGNYRESHQKGEAEIVYQNNDTFKGTVNNGHRDGYGLYNYSNGVQYQGSWHNDVKDGDGHISFQNGTTVSTTFLNGKPSSLCKISFSNGDIYEGQTKNLTIMHGQGKYTASDGGYLQGEFYHNQFTKGKVADNSQNIYTLQ